MGHDLFRFGNGIITLTMLSFSPDLCGNMGFSLADVANRSNRLCLAILFLIFGRSDVFVSILGFAALGLESTLPIPQLVRCIYLLGLMIV